MRNWEGVGVEHVATLVTVISLRNIKQQTVKLPTALHLLATVVCCGLKMLLCVVTLLTWVLEYFVPVQRYKCDGRAGLRHRVQNYIRGIVISKAATVITKSNSSSAC